MEARIRIALVIVFIGLCLSGCQSSSPPPNPPVTDARAIAVVPTAVSVPSIGAQSSLMPLGINPDGTLEVPPLSDPQQAGYWEYGATPGLPGAAVIAGHKNGDGKNGIFIHLENVKTGDKITVDRNIGGPVVFTVNRVVLIDKNNFPTQEVYQPTVDPELRLITCDGVFDPQAHSYESNLIVYAAMDR